MCHTIASRYPYLEEFRIIIEDDLMYGNFSEMGSENEFVTRNGVRYEILWITYSEDNTGELVRVKSWEKIIRPKASHS